MKEIVIGNTFLSMNFDIDKLVWTRPPKQYRIAAD